MNISEYKSQIQKLIAQRNGYLVLASGLVLLCLMLSLALMVVAGRDRIILMPPSLEKDSWVSHHAASPHYLYQMTLALTELALNVSPETVDRQQALLLPYVDTSYYPALKSQFVAEADKIKKEHITTAFFLTDIKIVNAKQPDLIIWGDLKSYVGDTELPTKRVYYHVRYRVDSFTALITLFQEVQHA